MAQDQEPTTQKRVLSHPNNAPQPLVAQGEQQYIAATVDNLHNTQIRLFERMQSAGMLKPEFTGLSQDVTIDNLRDGTWMSENKLFDIAEAKLQAYWNIDDRIQGADGTITYDPIISGLKSNSREFPDLLAYFNGLERERDLLEGRDVDTVRAPSTTNTVQHYKSFPTLEVITNHYDLANHNKANQMMVAKVFDRNGVYTDTNLSADESNQGYLILREAMIAPGSTDRNPEYKVTPEQMADSYIENFTKDANGNSLISAEQVSQVRAAIIKYESAAPQISEQDIADYQDAYRQQREQEVGTVLEARIREMHPPESTPNRMRPYSPQKYNDFINEKFNEHMERGFGPNSTGGEAFTPMSHEQAVRGIRNHRYSNLEDIKNGEANVTEMSTDLGLIPYSRVRDLVDSGAIAQNMVEKFKLSPPVRPTNTAEASSTAATTPDPASSSVEDKIRTFAGGDEFLANLQRPPMAEHFTGADPAKVQEGLTLLADKAQTTHPDLFTTMNEYIETNSGNVGMFAQQFVQNPTFAMSFAEASGAFNKAAQDPSATAAATPSSAFQAVNGSNNDMGAMFSQLFNSDVMQNIFTQFPFLKEILGAISNFFGGSNGSLFGIEGDRSPLQVQSNSDGALTRQAITQTGGQTNTETIDQNGQTAPAASSQESPLPERPPQDNPAILPNSF